MFRIVSIAHTKPFWSCNLKIAFSFLLYLFIVIPSPPWVCASIQAFDPRWLPTHSPHLLRRVQTRYFVYCREKPIARSRTPWIAVELYRHFGYFTLGAVSCLLFTEIAKFTIGRLRPHFLTLCKPEYSDELCKDGSYEKFVDLDEDEICLGLISNGGNTTKAQLHEARLSFLSGHSSFSFFCATFIVVYLQSRLANFPTGTQAYVNLTYRTLKISRPFLQFGLIILAFWISLTRISDYFHHPLDVATGALVGTLFACVTLVVCADIFNKHSIFWRSFQKYGQPRPNCSTANQKESELERLDTNTV